MKSVSPSSLGEHVFRASKDFDLVSADRLSGDDRQFLRVLEDDPEFYGVLRPVSETAGTMKAVGRDTALLLLTLREPGRLPAYVRRLPEDRYSADIVALVLDGVLEVRYGDRFVSGPEAQRLLFGARRDSEGAGFLARLSHAALRYAASLGIRNPRTLSRRLYAYNRLPISPRWERALSGPAAVLRYLRLGERSSLGRRLEARWALRGESEHRGWLAWSARNAGSRSLEAGPVYKLYLSPVVDALPDAVEALADACPGASAFKVGGDAAGLLRPDKVLLYFARFEDLGESAEILGQRLQGLAAHGVPFTAEIAGAGLLSWGMDPPAEELTFPDAARQSWRLWVCDRLGAALSIATSEERPERTPWRFALERLRLEGVDVEAWSPSSALWRSHPLQGV